MTSSGGIAGDEKFRQQIGKITGAKVCFRSQGRPRKNEKQFLPRFKEKGRFPFSGIRPFFTQPADAVKLCLSWLVLRKSRSACYPGLANQQNKALSGKNCYH